MNPVQLTKPADEDIDVHVAEVLAIAKGKDPTELDVALYDHVELDALNRLYDHAGGDGAAEWQFEFALEGITMTIRGDGRISATRREG